MVKYLLLTTGVYELECFSFVRKITQCESGLSHSIWSNNDYDLWHGYSSYQPRLWMTTDRRCSETSRPESTPTSILTLFSTSALGVLPELD